MVDHTMTTSKAPQYTLASAGAEEYLGKTRSIGKHHHHHHRRTNSEDPDPTDGNGSLTYSATSSVHSNGSSAAGESTDSSFADIMRVLDLQDSGELKAIMKKEGISSTGELRTKRLSGSVSVTSSLAYSMDGDSHLERTQLLQTIAGQPSYEQEGDVLFAAAEPGAVKKKHRTSITPKTKNSKRFEYSPGSPEGDTPTRPPPPSRSPPGTPPPIPRRNLEDEEDIWYAKWWMSCMPDSFKNLMPKR